MLKISNNNIFIFMTNALILLYLILFIILLIFLISYYVNVSFYGLEKTFVILIQRTIKNLINCNTIPIDLIKFSL